MTQGQLDPADRNETLLRMTDEVGHLVLRDNYDQNVVLSVEGSFASGLLPAHRRFLDVLVRAGDVDRRLEALPSSAELDRRAREGGGLTMPELSVLIAHAKITLGRAVLDSALPDEEWVAATLRGYFPAELGERFGDHLTDHPLRREIATTVLVNHVVGTGGLTFAFRAAEETGSDPADVVRAFVVASQVFGLPERAAAVEALDGQVEAYAQSRMRQAHQRLLDRSVRWLLHTRPEGIDVPAEIARFAPAVARLAPSIVDLDDAATLQAEAEWFTERGVPADEALRTVALLSLFPLLDVVEVADASGRTVEEIAAVWYELSRRYAITTVLEGIAALPRGDRWQSLARAALRDDLYSAVRDFTAAVVAEVPAGAPVDAADAVQAWETAHAPAVRRAQQTMTDLEGEPGAGDLAALSVGLRALRTVLRAG